MERQSQHPSSQCLQTYSFSVKTKSTVSIPRQCDAGVFWKLDIVSGSKSLLSFFSLVFGKTLQMAKQLFKMIWCRHACYHICRRNYSFSLKQNISNLCQSIFVFLTVYYDKIFKHWLESSSIRLRVCFFIAFVHK